MKSIIENSVYLVIMTLIALISIDFVSMNMGVSKVNELEQYIEEYIEIYGECEADNSMDNATFTTVSNLAQDNGTELTYEYVSKTEKYAYYKIHLSYGLRSRIFNLGKTHSYDGLVRVELGVTPVTPATP